MSARADPRGGRSAMVVPTATNNSLSFSNGKKNKAANCQDYFR